ncbi:hypothetical protein [Branchiibius sp. NY16-3462-2]|uniref:hypothetical protein n=1 Tax=Branchiibius sp. NY16-3462-2 TaxID=1807500 RepID=UPI0025C65ABC|nr:hypothetical protein [Branchiibius sp. NY16-3462-2]
MIVLLIIAMLVVVSLRNERWGTRDVVRSTGTVAALGAVATGIAIIVNIANATGGGDIDMTVPVDEYWPALNPGVTVEGPTATVAGGGFTSADVQVHGLDGATRALWVTGQVVGLLVPLTVCLLIVLACWKLLHGDPFVALVTRVALWTSVVVLVGGLASQILQQIAASRAAHALLDITSYTAPDVHGQELPTGLPRSTGGWTLSLWPVGAALLIAAFAALVRYGTRLQEDVEGLV